MRGLRPAIVSFGGRELDDVGHRVEYESMRPSELSDGLLFKNRNRRTDWPICLPSGLRQCRTIPFRKLVAVTRQQKRSLYRFAADG